MDNEYINLMVTEYKCPSCDQALHSCDDGKNRVIWCSRKSCDNVGANEGAYGKNDKEAYAVFRSKMGIDKK